MVAYAEMVGRFCHGGSLGVFTHGGAETGRAFPGISKTRFFDVQPMADRTS